VDARGNDQNLYVDTAAKPGYRPSGATTCGTARPQYWWQPADQGRSQIMGHATSSFTNDVHVSVPEELNEAAAVAISAYIPRRVINESPEGR
jgi:hypothetical protein